ncbi:transcriptional regulator family: Fungal Specific TF [Penicillium roqueforti]|nr:transcriptional regulator family: Fungal Specific TF [Penicillium roqueforti]KAI3166098.1 transcriptional regulator family: Fungal Specific TF [Penicillium roqueforti]KAI3242344.1 transcriptional regulator family: Fungal Specific TF [Penicillium roqueforti]KAI3269438.1 transcriptional regulator family: Fungal Specific TF [Penicillium roqueforti]
MTQQTEISPHSDLRAVSPVGDSVHYDILMPIDDHGVNHSVAAAPEGFHDFFNGAGVSLSGDFGDGTWPTGFSPGSFIYPSPGLPGTGHSEVGASSNANCLPLLMQENGSSICLDTQGIITPQLLGSSGDMDPFLIGRYRYDTSGASHFKNLSIHSVSSGPEPTQFLLSKPSIFAASREENGCENVSTLELRQELESLVPADIGLRLINLFERIIAPDYPILGLPGQLNPNTSPPYLLASVYLIVEPFTKFDERLCIDLAYDKPSGVALCEIINKALPYEIHAPKLCVVQTMLLLAIRPYPNPIVLDSGFRWSQLATLVACAHTLGLHLDPKSWRIPPWQIAQRRRLSYFIYSTDKWLALSLGRPPLLHYDNWLVTSLSQEDQPDSGLDPLAWMNIMKRAELDAILDRVLAQLYSPRAINTMCTDNHKTVALTGPLLESLFSWHRPVSVPSTDVRSLNQGRPIGLERTLEMNYHYIHLSISRAILRPFLQPTVENLNEAEYIMAREQARIRAETCILAAAEFIHELRPEDFEVLWPAWSATAFSSICFQILNMAATSIDRNEADKWVTCLNKVRRDMRLKADVLPCLHLGLLRIDSIFWKGVDSVLHLEEHVQQAFASGSSIGRAGPTK